MNNCHSLDSLKNLIIDCIFEDYNPEDINDTIRQSIQEAEDFYLNRIEKIYKLKHLIYNNEKKSIDTNGCIDLPNY